MQGLFLELLEGLVVTHVGPRKGSWVPPAAFRRPGEWKFPSCYSATQMLWNSSSPMHDIPCSKKCSNLLVLFWEASPLLQELVVEMILYANPRDVQSFVEGLMDFDIISQVAQTQMINKSCWESGRRGNATERIRCKQMQWRSPRGIASREIRYITIRLCDFYRLRCYEIHKEHGSL